MQHPILMMNFKFIILNNGNIVSFGKTYWDVVDNLYILDHFHKENWEQLNVFHPWTIKWLDWKVDII